MVATKPHPLAIVGPTAAGKTEVALAVAEGLRARGQTAEIVACDSVQIYRGFDLGTGKPSLAQRQQVPHHLLDIADWSAPGQAQAWCAAASACLDAIGSRGALPLLCGGTGLYLRSLRFGLVQLPPIDAGLRRRLRQRAADDPAGLHAELGRLDPPTAARLHPKSLAHVLRALEICLQTGEPASRLRAAQRQQTPQRPLQLVVLDWPTPLLRQRIAERSARMLEAGLLDEVAGLLAQGVDPGCAPMQSVGYRECADHLAGRLVQADLLPQIVSRTWQYARRQRTWWRQEADCLRICMEQAADLAQAAATILAQAGQFPGP
jgi:tRNA dimethylallyltransferase